MKVIINISPLKTPHKARGIGMYTKRLTQALHRVDEKEKYILTTRSEHIKDADLVHYPYFDLFFHTLPLRKKTKTVVTIHDVIPLIFPQDFPAGIRGNMNFLLQKMALRKVEYVITDSYNSKNDIEKYLGIDRSRIQVVYLAASDEFKPMPKEKVKNILNKYRLPNNYILYVGDLNPNKNLIRLIKAFDQVQKNNPNLHLVLVGRAFADQKLPQMQKLTSAILKLNLIDKVKIVSNVPLDPATDLAAIYNGARVYVQPSLYEGFGLPILEAFACQTPVVASSTSSIPEICGEAAIFMDPYRKTSIAKGINRVLKLSNKKRNQLTAKGLKQSGKFSWDKTARETISVYRRAIGKGE